MLLDLGLVGAARQLSAAMNLSPLGQEARVLTLHGRDSEDLSLVVESWCPTAYTDRTTRRDAWFIVPPQHPSLTDLAKRVAARDSGARALVSPLVRLEDVGAVRARQAARMPSLQPGRLDLLDEAVWDDRDLATRLDAFLKEQQEPVVAALVGYLRNRGQWEQASRHLGVHRNTLRHRIGRARQILGVDIDDPDNAARLWLLLRARGLA